MEYIENLVSWLSGIVWGAPMLILLVGTGVYLTIILKGMQFWALPHAIKLIFKKEDDAEGEISHFAALMTALAANCWDRKYRRSCNSYHSWRPRSCFLDVGNWFSWDGNEVF